jgi:hypothetical protein
MILTREQVALLDYEDTKKALRKIERSGLIDKPLTKLIPDEYQMVEDLSNTILYLEDAIRDFEDLRMNPQNATV